MKSCPVCRKQYDARLHYCARDGSKLLSADGQSLYVKAESRDASQISSPRQTGEGSAPEYLSRPSWQETTGELKCRNFSQSTTGELNEPGLGVRQEPSEELASPPAEFPINHILPGDAKFNTNPLDPSRIQSSELTRDLVSGSFHEDFREISAALDEGELGSSTSISTYSDGNRSFNYRVWAIFSSILVMLALIVAYNPTISMRQQATVEDESASPKQQTVSLFPDQTLPGDSKATPRPPFRAPASDTLNKTLPGSIAEPSPAGSPKAEPERDQSRAEEIPNNLPGIKSQPEAVNDLPGDRGQSPALSTTKGPLNRGSIQESSSVSPADLIEMVSTTQGQAQVAPIIKNRIRTKIPGGYRYEFDVIVQETAGVGIDWRRATIRQEADSGRSNSQASILAARIPPKGRAVQHITINMIGQSENDWRGRAIYSERSVDATGAALFITYIVRLDENFEKASRFRKLSYSR